MRKSLSRTLQEAISERSNDYTSLEKKYVKIVKNSLLSNPFAAPQAESATSISTVTVIIPAYNAIESIFACLASIEQSSFNLKYQNRLEVIVVDDGSTDGTWDTLKDLRLSLNLTGIRQNHHSAAHARNTGISVASGDIIVVCDVDMVLSYYAIEQLIARHQQMPNVLLAGFRCGVSKKDPRVNPRFIQEHGTHLDSHFAKDERIVYPSSGWPNNMCLESNHYKGLGYGRGLWMPDGDDWDDMWTLFDLVYGCLFSLQKDTYYNLKGYDERFYGWGCEDGFLAAKAFAAGQYILPIYSASGLHIKHLPRTNNKQLEYIQNRKTFHRLIKTSRITDHPNWLSQAKKRIVESFFHSPVTMTSKLAKYKFINEETNSSLDNIDNLLAIGEYSQVLSILSTNSYNDADKFVRQSKALIGLNKYEDAINILKEISMTNNLKPESVIDLAIAKAATGKFSSARTILKNLSEAHPETPDLLYWYKSPAQEHIRQGKKYLRQEFYSVARRCFEAALIMDPSNRMALKLREECMVNE